MFLRGERSKDQGQDTTENDADPNTDPNTAPNTAPNTHPNNDPNTDPNTDPRRVASKVGEMQKDRPRGGSVLPRLVARMYMLCEGYKKEEYGSSMQSAPTSGAGAASNPTYLPCVYARMRTASRIRPVAHLSTCRSAGLTQSHVYPVGGVCDVGLVLGQPLAPTPYRVMSNQT